MVVGAMLCCVLVCVCGEGWPMVVGAMLCCVLVCVCVVKVGRWSWVLCCVVYLCVCVVKVGRWSWVQYFTAETTEAVSRQFFIDSQKLVFIVDGLSLCLLPTVSSYHSSL